MFMLCKLRSGYAWSDLIYTGKYTITDKECILSNEVWQDDMKSDVGGSSCGLFKVLCHYLPKRTEENLNQDSDWMFSEWKSEVLLAVEHVITCVEALYLKLQGICYFLVCVTMFS